MKIRVTLKDPDGFWDAVTEAVETAVFDIGGLAEDEVEALVETRRDDAFKQISPWVEYKEYVVIVFDTEAKTATVIKS